MVNNLKQFCFFIKAKIKETKIFYIKAVFIKLKDIQLSLLTINF